MNNLLLADVNYKNILKNVNLALENNRIIALMGPTGSGKTTLLKCIFGLLNYTGSISINGNLMTEDNISVIRKDIGINLGLTNLIDNNVFSNIIEPLENLNIDTDKARKRVYEISKRLGIESLLYKDIKMLSYSQKKIISFARSIIHEPKIILLDRIFDSLNKNYTIKIITYLNYLKKNKKCIIIFTTNNSEYLNICDNLIIINNGKIIVNKKISDLLNDENIFNKNNIKLPFLTDLSYKLISYDLIDHLIFDYDEMVDEIWKLN